MMYAGESLCQSCSTLLDNILFFVCVFFPFLFLPHSQAHLCLFTLPTCHIPYHFHLFFFYPLTPLLVSPVLPSCFPSFPLQHSSAFFSFIFLSLLLPHSLPLLSLFLASFPKLHLPALRSSISPSLHLPQLPTLFFWAHSSSCSPP